jgi:hypothetical protein
MKHFMKITPVLMMMTVLCLMVSLMVPDTMYAVSGTVKMASGQDLAPENARFVRVGGHHGTYRNATITWESKLVVDDAKLPAGRRISLAYRLPPGTELVRSTPHGAQAVRSESGEVVGIDFPSGMHASGTVQLTLRQPFEAPGALSPPLVAGRIIQRVTLDGAIYDASPTSAAPLYPGHRAQQELSDRQIDWCEESLGDVSEATGVPIFVMPDSTFFATGALDGELVDEQTHRSGRFLTIVVGFGALLAILGAAFYLLTRRARHEEADAFLSQMSTD